MNADEMVVYAESLSERKDIPASNNGSGAYRCCFLRGGYAFKLSHQGEERANRAEYDFYAMTTDNIRRLLVKPLYISRNGAVIVMEQVKPHVPYPDYLPFVDDLQHELRTTYGFGFSDMGMFNIGTREDGSMCVMDYGEMYWYGGDIGYCKTQLAFHLEKKRNEMLARRINQEVVSI